jgi:hypothetical protein
MHRIVNTAATGTPASIASWTDGSRQADSNRRAHERLVAHELDWLKSARLRSGAPLSLIDISAGGALFETPTPLGPGSTASLTITGEGIQETARFRLLRCEVASLKGGLVYRGACEFDRLLKLPVPIIGADRSQTPETETPSPGQPVLDEAQVLALIQSVARRMPDVKLGSNLGAIVAETHSALARGDSPQAILRLIEAQLGATRNIAALDSQRGSRFEPARLASAQPNPDPRATNGWNRIVVRYLDGHLLKGYCQDFHPARPTFHVSPATVGLDTTPVLVPMAQLKAIFFVRDFAGNPQRVERKEFEKTNQGRRIEVTFLDDEVLLGSTLGYRPDGTGFFVTPADSEGNNIRVYVLHGAIRHIRYV